MKKENFFKALVIPGLIFLASPLFSQQDKTASPRKYEVWEDTSQIQLQWFLPGNHKLKDFKIFRSLQLKNQFSPINVEHGFSGKKDTLLFLVFDKTVTPNFAYDYYIVPLDENGAELPKSEIIAAKSYNINILPLVKRLKAVGLSEEKAIMLSWEIAPSPYLRSISIYRSENHEAGYELIANVPPTQRQYTDKVLRGNENYYYYLAVNGPFGEGYPSAKVFGMYEAKEKPLPPQKINAEADGKGARISWTPLNLTVNGFYVYRSDGYQGELKQISPLIPPDTSEMFYADTSSFLKGGEIYSYSVTTVGQGGIESDFSERASILSAKPAQFSAPKNLRAKVMEGNVLLLWEDLTETQDLVSGYRVYRKVKGKNEFELLTASPLENHVNYYEDRNISEGVSFEYAVATVDISGNEGRRSMTVEAAIPVILPPAPSGLLLFKTSEGIKLQWNLLADENVKEFRIYRSEGGAAYKALTTVAGNLREYADKSAAKGKVYVYYITCANQKGKESGASDEVSLRF